MFYKHSLTILYHLTTYEALEGILPLYLEKSVMPIAVTLSIDVGDSRENIERKESYKQTSRSLTHRLQASCFRRPYPRLDFLHERHEGNI